ncbi:hypothetical protein D3C80_1354210 [compost metagenome]
MGNSQAVQGRLKLSLCNILGQRYIHVRTRSEIYAVVQSQKPEKNYTQYSKYNRENKEVFTPMHEIHFFFKAHGCHSPLPQIA